jgi:flagellar motor switch protein FliN/FliY
VASDVRAILALEVPVIVRVGERVLTLGEVISLVPGAIIELAKHAEDELDLLVNNKQIGTGTAVKVGENFGLRISFIGDVRQRIAALGQSPAAADVPAAFESGAEPALAGQI